MIDEKSKRKPNFDEANSAPVVLADGQAWYLPKPWVEIRPTFRSGRAVESTPALTCGPEFDAMKKAVDDAEAEDDVIIAGATLTAFMVLRNYDLADDELGGLLVFRDGATWFRDAMAIANGATAPKVSGAGSG